MVVFSARLYRICISHLSSVLSCAFVRDEIRLQSVTVTATMAPLTLTVSVINSQTCPFSRFFQIFSRFSCDLFPSSIPGECLLSQASTEFIYFFSKCPQ